MAVGAFAVIDLNITSAVLISIQTKMAMFLDLAL